MNLSFRDCDITIIKSNVPYSTTGTPFAPERDSDKRANTPVQGERLSLCSQAVFFLVTELLFFCGLILVDSLFFA
jgi:hypothetical protein